MGVPAFYRWLVNRYPKVVVNAIDEDHPPHHPQHHCISSTPNPNGIEFDNLYLDMNGIIHPCFHPDDDVQADDGVSSAAPNTFEDVFNNIFDYIDRLLNVVRPRKLLYMAIDGVAPRAKMNQQRARRFRNAKDKEFYEAEEMRLRKQFEIEGKQVLPKQESDQLLSDSNIITPGTEFMHELSKALQAFINLRLASDLGWKGIQVILSDANVPGEGEHKIMSFIRYQRQLPTYNANTRHCIYGLDADLIMLALATHEVHFSILREDVLVQTHNFQNSKSVSETGANNVSAVVRRKKPYQFLHVWILREYLELDMKISDPPENEKLDLERFIDDFIFMCFFMGNDFLPHMPTLEIHEGGIDLLMNIYKKEFKKFGGYLVDMSRVEDKKAGYIKLSRVEKFILLVGAFEEEIFKKRTDLRVRKLKHLLNNSNNEEEEDNFGSLAPTEILSVENVLSTRRLLDSQASYTEMLNNTKELKEKLKDNIRKSCDLFCNGGFGADRVRLGSTGFKQRYYKVKFSAEQPEEMESTRKNLVEKYTEGLLWVLLYYFSNPPSWTWFYPFHHGPFASDLKGLSQIKVKFQKGSPFKPFEQLMAVLPPRSAHALPKAYRPLLVDASSNIIDFYPNDFEVDMDGKRFLWQGICKLPFIEEERMLPETKNLEKELEGEEVMRNSEQLHQLFVQNTHKLASQILSLSENKSSEAKIGCSLMSVEIGGCVRHQSDTNNEDSLHDRKQEEEEEEEEENALCVRFELPDCGPFVPRLLQGVTIPDKIVTEDDLLQDTPLWHEYQGPKPPNRIPNQFRFSKANMNGNSSNSAFNDMLSSSNGHKLAGSGCLSAGRGKPSSGPNNWKHKGSNSDFNDMLSSYNGHKFAGSGWSSAGRGNPNSGPNNSMHKGSNSAFNGQKPTGSGWSSAGGGKPNSGPNNSLHKGSGWVPVWRSGAEKPNYVSSQTEVQGFKELTISSSGPSQSSTSRVNFNGRVQPVNNSYRPSRNGSSQDRNHAWQSSAGGGKPNSGPNNSLHKGSGWVPAWSSGGEKPNYGSSQTEVQGFKELTISSSSPSQSSTSWVNFNGRVQPVNNSYRPSRNGSSQDRNHAWQSGFQANGTRPSQAGWDQQSGSTYTSYRGSGSAANSSMQGRGRGRYDKHGSAF